MKRVLLIDDEEEFTEGVKINLEGSGEYVVDEINDPREAIEHAREHRPDIILLDIIMPDMDGCDVLKQFETDPDLNSVPILVVTAMFSPESAGSVMVDTGDVPMIAKPVSVENLVAAMEELMGRQDASASPD